jgi:RNA polymerase primary sigma factor
MGTLSRIRNPAIADLARQLRFGSREALRRQIERVEEFAGEIDPEQSYPIDFVAFRITGYRGAELPAGGVITGAALVADLSGVIERLCEAAEVELGDPSLRGGLSATDLAKKWGVSRKTLARYRRFGLIARHAIGTGGRTHALFMPAVVARVEAARSRELVRAADFTRIDEATRKRMLSRAARYRARFKCSLNQIAARLAERFGRSHEAVRQVLRKHERATGKSNVAPGPLDARGRRFVERALRRGIEPAAIAAHVGRERQGVVRAAAMVRAAMLKDWIQAGLLDRPESPVFSRADSAEVILAPPVVRSGLAGECERTFGELVAVRKLGPTSAKEERERALACHFLVRRAAGIAATIDRLHPEPTKIDECFTMLRWATLLKVVLMRSQLPLLVSTIESVFATPIELVPLGAPKLRELIGAGLSALSEAVNLFDATRGGRLAAPAGLALNRAVTRVARSMGAEQSGPQGRVRALARPSMDLPIGAWERMVDPWQGAIDLDARFRDVLRALDPADRRMIERRTGWDGSAPATLAQVAKELRTTPMRAAMLERRAIRIARATLRGEASVDERMGKTRAGKRTKPGRGGKGAGA